MNDRQAKVLVVEDDRHISELISYNLKKEGYCVWQTFDGINAKRILEEHSFDMVVLDIMLPGVDGFEICKKIKSLECGFKTFVIVISAKTSEQDRLYAHILGADCYLTKPFSVSALMNITTEFDSIRNKEFLVKTK